MKKKLVTFGVLTAAWLIFWLISKDTLDPDFGWHIRSGEEIVKSGIPKTDPFSYTMPSYPVVDFEWATNVFWYLAYPFLGLSGLTFVYAGMAVFSMWLAIPGKFKKYAWLPVMLGWSVMLSRFSVRAQVSGWFCWAVTMAIISDEKSWQRRKWMIPPVMLIWVNTHGSFPMGLIGLGIWLGARVYTQKRIAMGDLAVWIFGAMATLINPYGVRIWELVYLLMSQTGLYVRTVAEWMPFYFRPDIGMIMAAVTVAVLGWKFRDKIALWQWILTGWTLIGSISSLRHGPVFMIAVAGTVAGLMGQLENLAVRTDPSGKDRFRMLNRIFIGIGILILVAEISLVIAERQTLYRQNSFYPVMAADILKSGVCPGRLFSKYEWGGYLLWKIPAERVFIDGRMAGFKWNPPPGESGQIYEEYLKMLEKPEVLINTLDKYGVNTVLWSKPVYYRENDQEKWIGRTFFRNSKNNTANLNVSDILSGAGWVTWYKDNVAVILCRKTDR